MAAMCTLQVLCYAILRMTCHCGGMTSDMVLGSRAVCVLNNSINIMRQVGIGRLTVHQATTHMKPEALLFLCAYCGVSGKRIGKPAVLPSCDSSDARGTKASMLRDVREYYWGCQGLGNGRICCLVNISLCMGSGYLYWKEVVVSILATYRYFCFRDNDTPRKVCTFVPTATPKCAHVSQDIRTCCARITREQW